ncbi:hypothetical protein A4X13_0g7876 [Tilletia indica]|uniref:Uncharacterized protein n=1 Tax=Tilletia indica TaxID=43049 RepID=A0A8T8SHD6_9BASI|nr:hypothetical protein A4X13_0g7876 [Tilletia indica]
MDTEGKEQSPREFASLPPSTVTYTPSNPNPVRVCTPVASSPELEHGSPPSAQHDLPTRSESNTSGASSVYRDDDSATLLAAMLRSPLGSTVMRISSVHRKPGRRWKLDFSAPSIRQDNPSSGGRREQALQRRSEAQLLRRFTSLHITDDSMPTNPTKMS